MLGIRYIRIEPTSFVMQFKGGKVVREGAGLSFFYFSPTTSLVLVPIGSVDAPFIFSEVTGDFQDVTIQGQLTYRVVDPKKLSSLMNFTLASNGREYSSDDPAKVSQRLINQVQVLTSASVKGLSLKQALVSSDNLTEALRKGLRSTEAITAMGIEIMGLSILAVRPTPEMARALEAETRETLLRQADEALYMRRNAAVEQERAIKENELNTEIAVENKKRQIKETQMEAEKSVQVKKRELMEAEMAARVSLEEKKRELVDLASVNSRAEADAKAYSVEAVTKPLARMDPKVLQALLSSGMDASRLVAMAFRDLAEGADRIGQLNITPDLLRELMSDGQGSIGRDDLQREARRTNVRG